MERRVYLAGPIHALNYQGSNGWREYARQELQKYGIIAVSPMRAKEHLNHGELILGADNNVISSQRGLTTRDRWDVMSCDVMLANLFGAEEVSKGTMIEYGWADAFRKPIVTVMEKEGNLHDHPIVRELTGFRVETLEEGLYVAKAILYY